MGLGSSFGISAEGAYEALNNRVENLTGIPANLPEGSFTITPKKKFNVPKIENVGESFSEFRGRGNTRGFYNIPSYANVNGTARHLKAVK